MRSRIVLLLPFIIFFSYDSLANDAITTMSDYTQHAMTELAATPPLMLLKNVKGKSRHEAIAGYIKTKTDDDATLSTGVVTQETGDANGFGLGYGYAHSYKEKWAFFVWLQAIEQQGSHTQTTNGVTTAQTNDIAGVNINLALGLSYEFFRDSEKHTLNVFGGPSLMMLEISGAIETFDTSGTITSAFDGSYDGLLPGVMLGTMYEYKFFENVQVIPYAMIVYSLADECQTYRVDNVSLSDPSVQANSPECDAGATGTVEGETDISPSFATIGIKFNYIPWDLGFNVSGLIRDAILRSDNEERATVKGAFFSLSKSWGK